MAETKSEIIYPEMLEYAWVKDMDRVVAHSKHVKQDYSGQSVTVDQLPKCPINLILAVMKEAMSYPEVMEAYGSAPLNGQIPKREAHLLMWFNEYLIHKYGSTPDPRMSTKIPLRKIANGQFSDLNDPALIDELLHSPLVSEDDGNDYNQLPAET